MKARKGQVLSLGSRSCGNVNLDPNFYLTVAGAPLGCNKLMECRYSWHHSLSKRLEKKSHIQKGCGAFFLCLTLLPTLGQPTSWQTRSTPEEVGH
ncbi:hypothetical protein AV530_006986 [Patagioenas fasciata monilis]|uniref:Uncharacterized protein n=1 Tax=Patagioenas fasciata monilis TaxID=372326 RepID=A0A1V4JHA0_PATFA|nr:hypothetical protein AV530_006986 [Patagioenas fasciata monilis]